MSRRPWGSSRPSDAALITLLAIADVVLVLAAFYPVDFRSKRDEGS